MTGIKGFDPASLGLIKQLQEDINSEAAANTAPVAADAPAPQQRVPAVQGGVDRGGALGRLSTQGVQFAALQAVPASGDGDLKTRLQAGLAEEGLLPPPPTQVSKADFDRAQATYIERHMQRGDFGQGGDVDEMFAMIEALLNRENARSNPRPQQWSGRPNSGAQRPAGLPSSSSPAYANRGPAPNQGALQQQAAQSIATANPPPPAGSINARVAEATRAYMGTSTAAGPDGGNLACAWSVNNILANAGLQKVGSNTNYVPSVEQALQGGRGTPIDASQTQPGDIVIWPHGHHIGIAMGNGQVADNSSSRAAFVNMRALPAGARVYRLNS